MKNFTRLLMAVVLLASYSCVQDTTEDLAPVISVPTEGNGGTSTLQVSLPAPSRTALGEEVDGKYPVSWSENDVLAVNGKPTTSIRISEAAANVAVFDLPLGITIPYNIVYPYQGDDVEVISGANKYPVLFATEQMHTEGTFAQNSAPMFAWSNGFGDIEMEHLATALRFSIKAKAGESVDLSYISVSTIAAEPISGVFDVYCTDSDAAVAGTLEARDSAISTVFYNFEGGSHIIKSDAAEVFYIAVPKGEYAGFEVNFVSVEGEVCARTFAASGDKQLLGGKVREFPMIEFEVNSKMYLISEDKDMEKFASQVNAGTFNDKYDGALLVNDIDMTDKAWTPIDGFNSLFEGRNYTIKGMTTPLFGENVTGTISNVNVNGNIVEKEHSKVGLVARSLAAGGTIFNCKVDGSITYENPNIKLEKGRNDLVNVGGVVGGVHGGSVTVSESSVDITIVTAGPVDATDAYNPCIGGVVGYACGEGEALPVVVNNLSNGVIIWDDNSKGKEVTPFIGGVAGYMIAGTFTDNVNTGELYINEPMYDLDWGGVIGASATSVERCENKGSLYINEAVTKANIGGVLGKLSPINADTNADTKPSIVSCENSGKLLFDEKFLIKETCYIGGVVAYVDKNTANVAECLNSGSVTYYGSCAFADRIAVVGNANIVLGGVVGISWSEAVKSCRNTETAVMNIAGAVAGSGDIMQNTQTGDNIGEVTAIAGVIGIRAGKKDTLGCSSDVTTEDCSNKGNVKFTWKYCGASYIFSSACIGVLDSDRVVSCKNEGFVSIEARVSDDNVADPDTNTLIIFASGMFGCIASNCEQIEDCVNAGSVEIVNSRSRMLWVSGLLGTAYSGVSIKFSRCGNSGNIVVGEDVTARNIYLGGILSNTLSMKLQYPNCFNSGTIECKATTSAETHVGSIFGTSSKSDNGSGTEGIQNSGSVIFSGKSHMAYIGGYCGSYAEEKHSVQFSNASSAVVEFKGTAERMACVGGIIGLAGTADLTVNSQGIVTEYKSIKTNPGGEFEKGMTNNGKVVVSGYAPDVYVAGGFGYAAVASKGISGITNNGDIEIAYRDPEYTDLIVDRYHMGGVFGYATMSVAYPASAGGIAEDKAIRDCYNSGDLLYNGIARDGAYIGGLVGRAVKAPISNCSNDGRLVSTGHAGNSSPKLTQTQDKDQHTGYAFNYKTLDLAMGGIVGETDLDIVNTVNEGKVTHTCTLNPLKVDHNGNLSTSRFDVGGIAGRTFCPHSQGKNSYVFTLEGLTNNGAVTIYGAPSATNNTPSIDLADNGDWQWTDVDDWDRTNNRLFYRVNVAGLIGRLMDNSSAKVDHQLSGCINNGTISVPEAAGAKCLSIAGAVGDLLVCKAQFTNVRNSGKISVEKAGVGTNISGALFIDAFFINLAGIVATYHDTRIFQYNGNYHQLINFDNCVNDGDIHYGETGASAYQCAGGIMGQVLYWRRDNCIGSRNSRESYTGSGTRYSSVGITFNRCKNNGNIDYLSTAMNLSQGYNYNYAGGILGTGNIGHGGYTQTYGSVDLTFDHCENTGSVQFDRNNGSMSTNASPAYTAVGGIVGHYCGGIGTATTNKSYSTSGRGTITTKDPFTAQIISCKNSGRIWGNSGYIGGIIGCGNWYVKITGTEDDPTINTGDIVVVRENGKVVTANRYGAKYIYAGGIAGVMREYVSAGYAVANPDGNPSWPAYEPEEQYCRIEYAVNEGTVGSTGYAGGIAGYYYSAVEASKLKTSNKVCEHRGGMEFCRNTGDIYALEGSTTNVGALVGMPRMLSYSANENSTTAIYLSERAWSIGVHNCYVGGTLLRGAIGTIKVDETNYMNAIYGENWLEEYESIEVEKPYDGCELYVPKSETPSTPETPDEGGEEGDGEEPDARR